MNASILNEAYVCEWNALVERESSFSMMQTWGWGDVKSHLGWEPYRVGVMADGHILAGAQMLIKHMPIGVGNVAYIPRGPIGSWKDPIIVRFLFDELHKIARHNNAVFLKIEPAISSSVEMQKFFTDMGFQQSSVANQPCATIAVDILPDHESILRSMRDSTRRKIQSTGRKGVSTRIGTMDDLPVFYKLIEVTAQRAGFALRSYKYYETEFGSFFKNGQAALFLAEYQGEILAAHIAYAVGRHAAFFHQASSNTTSNLNPNCLLVWEEIKWAKSKGCSTYDLWGVPDEIAQYIASGQEIDTERTDGLWGVLRFKGGFSKNIICYLGALDYVYSPLLYKVIANKQISQSSYERLSAWMDTHILHHKDVESVHEQEH